MQSFIHKIVELPAYRAIGLKWDGSWSEVEQLGSVIHAMQDRVGELNDAVNPKLQLGLSYHTRIDGFVHYSVYEVGESQHVPQGMVEISIPRLTYLFTQHERGHDIGRTYQMIKQWVDESNYEVYREKGVDYFQDPLPIKHERYPDDRDKNDPHFEIYIPIVTN